jgi:hypothetical protein
VAHLVREDEEVVAPDAALEAQVRERDAGQTRPGRPGGADLEGDQTAVPQARRPPQPPRPPRGCPRGPFLRRRQLGTGIAPSLPFRAPHALAPTRPGTPEERPRADRRSFRTASSPRKFRGMQFVFTPRARPADATRR